MLLPASQVQLLECLADPTEKPQSESTFTNIVFPEAVASRPLTGLHSRKA